MLKLYKRFDIFLNWLLLSTLGVSVVVSLIAVVTQKEADILKSFIVAILTLAISISLFFGLLYLVIGVVLSVIGFLINNNNFMSYGGRLILKGIVRSFISFLLFFLLSLTVSYFNPQLMSDPLPTLDGN